MVNLLRKTKYDPIFGINIATCGKKFLLSCNCYATKSAKHQRKNSRNKARRRIKFSVFELNHS